MKKGQIWIETVIYTLIGLALIGVVLALVTPKVGQAQDKIVVEQSIDTLSILDDKIIEALDRGPGNTRIVDITLRKGELVIDPTKDEISIKVDDLKKPYSEPGVEIDDFGRVSVLSEQGQKTSSVILTLDYTNITNITYRESGFVKKFNSATTPYRFLIHNMGSPAEGGFIILDIQEKSGL